MPLLVRFEAVAATSEVLADEVVVADLGTLETIEKVVRVAGSEVLLRFTFDPPLRVPAGAVPDVEQEAA